MAIQNVMAMLIPYLYRKPRMMTFFIEKKTRMFRLHMVHNNWCELLPASKSSLETLQATDMDAALALAQLHFEQVRPCSACATQQPAGGMIEQEILDSPL